jgi:hypothetical protein
MNCLLKKAGPGIPSSALRAPSPGGRRRGAIWAFGCRGCNWDHFSSDVRLSPSPRGRGQGEGDPFIGNRTGFILYSVLIVILLSAMVAISLLFSMKAEQTAAAAGEQGEQAWETALSGVHHAMKIVQDSPPGWLTWQDNASEFQRQLLMDDGSEQWYFTVYQKNDIEGQAIRYGLTDESSKLNLLHCPSDWLTNGSSSPLVQLLSSSRVGAENLMGYGPTNELSFALGSVGANAGRAYEMLDAVISASGINTRVLFGKDMDLNLAPDAGTEDIGVAFQQGTGAGALGMGLRHMLTVVSYDLNVDGQGAPRIDLNDPKADLEGLELSESVTNYLFAMRKDRKKIGHPAELLEASGTFKDKDNKDVELKCELKPEELALLLDRCAATNAATIPGLININTASVDVLTLLPGIDESIADSIVAGRRGMNAEQLKTTAWLFQQGLLDAAAFKRVAPYITARSWQYHFHVAGFSLPSGRYRVLEALVDVACKPPRIVFLRDLTRMGLPFKVNAGPEYDLQQSSSSAAP